jgi:glycosyltransferase involved in cell wall biosynthesis
MKYAEKDGRIRVVDKPNGGVSSARNAGLDAATGDYIMFCDSDDWVEPDWCSALYENRQQNGLTICMIDEPGADVEIYPVEKELVERKLYMHRPSMMCAIYNKLFLKEIIDTNHIRFAKELSLGEDFCFCMAYLTHAEGNLGYVYRKLYHYVIATGFSLTKSVPSLEACVQYYQELTESMKQIGIEDAQSIANRNRSVMIHFERFLAKTANCSEISLKEKLSIAAAVERMEAVVSCSYNGVKWGNPLYILLMRHNKVQLAMVFLVLRSFRDCWKEKAAFEK